MSIDVTVAHRHVLRRNKFYAIRRRTAPPSPRVTSPLSTSAALPQKAGLDTHRPDGIGLDDRRHAVPAAIGPLQRTRTPAHKNSGAQEVSAQENVGCQPPSGARCAFVTSGFPIEQHDRLILRLFHGAARSSTGLRPRVAYCRSLPVCSEMPLSAPWAAISSERPRSASATNPTSRLLWSMTGSRLT
jgi:hypothetical protein